MEIPKGDGSRQQLIAEVEDLFELTPEKRDTVEQLSCVATSPGEPNWTYLKFYEEANLVDCEIAGQPLTTENYILPDGTPDGGWAEAPGLQVRWQKGALEFDADGPAWNGLFLVTLLRTAKAQLEFYQRGRFASADNVEALEYVTEAISVLNRRQIQRFTRGVRGKHEE